MIVVILLMKFECECVYVWARIFSYAYERVCVARENKEDILLDFYGLNLNLIFIKFDHYIHHIIFL